MKAAVPMIACLRPFQGSAVPNEPATALVVTLHGVGNASTALNDAGAARYQVATELFAHLVETCAAAPVCRAAAFSEQRSGAWLVLTFDDGLLSDFDVVAPMLAEAGLCGTFFVTTSNVGRPGYATWDHLRQMADAGMEIASHGIRHEYLVTKPRRDAMREMRDSKLQIEHQLGLRVRAFAPVGGHHQVWMSRYARQVGYVAFATMVPGLSVADARWVELRRNHVQAHHTAYDIDRLVARDRRLLWRNRIRYELLRLPKVALGMPRYDRVKRAILRLADGAGRPARTSSPG